MSHEAGADLTDAAARLAGIADALGESDWCDELRRAGAVPIRPRRSSHMGPGRDDRARCRRGSRAPRGDWDDARHQAAFLADFFTRRRKQLHGVAGVAFEGLALAARGRDREDLDEHAELIRALFGADADQVTKAA